MKSLNEDSDNKKSRDGFIEATRAVELMSFDEVEGLAETMFKGGMGGRQTGVQSKGGTVPVSVPFSVPVRFGSIFSVPRFFTVPKSYTK